MTTPRSPSRSTSAARRPAARLSTPMAPYCAAPASARRLRWDRKRLWRSWANWSPTWRSDSARERICGVGVCSPGPLDTISGTALGVPTLAGFADLPLRRMLEERFGLPVRLENDGIAAAIGEWRFGAGRGFDNVLYVTVSTGIGAGVISEGRVLRGRRGLAGHAGHMTIVRDGDRCSCGNRGCWEAYGAGPAFTHRARRRAAPDRSSALHVWPPRSKRRTSLPPPRRATRWPEISSRRKATSLASASLRWFISSVPTWPSLAAACRRPSTPWPRACARVSKSPPCPRFEMSASSAAKLGDNSGLIGAAALAMENRAP